MSDVPVGLQLSGGVDSSLIAYYLKQNQAGNLHTFSIGFSDPEHADWSEERYARHVAGEMGLEHHQIN
ncbi:MAG: asparagine synthase-related protein, partial [Bacteroidia bacterium]